MNTRTSNRRARHMIASVLVIMGASAALAANPPATSQPAPSKEMREKMASLHEQMAACLRSDKPIPDCRSQMMRSCQGTMGKHACHGMGRGMGGSGAGRPGHMMDDGANNSEGGK